MKSIEERKVLSQEKIRKILKGTGTASITEVPEYGIKKLIPGDFKPYPMQLLTEKMVTDHIQFDLLLIESLMGDGKTEAAFWAAMRALKEKGLQGIYFALPTTATAEGMIARICEMLGLIEITEPVNLATGKAWSTAFMDGSVEAVHLYKTIGTKIMSHYSVGTVDQALFSVCKSRFNDISLSAISNTVLVIDEFHAYDSYMMVEIRRLLEWMKEFGCPVVLLSATLTDRIKKELFSIYEVKEKIAQDYPLVSLVSNGKLFQESCQILNHKRYNSRIKFANCLGDIEGTSSLAASTVKDGGNLLVCVNTVRRARAIYENIVKNDPSVEATLFTGLTSDGLKEKTGSLILGKYGKKGKRDGIRPDRSIVVATSIISESLDVDFDFLICEIKPIDILFQTMGRQGRHDSEGTIRTSSWYIREVIILAPPNVESEDKWEKLSNPYSASLLLATYKTLQAITSISMPDDMRYLINSAYEEAGDKWISEIRGDAAKAEEYVIDSPSAKSFRHDIRSEMTREKKTRLEKYPTINVTLLETNERSLSYDTDETEKLLKWSTVKNVPLYYLPEEIIQNAERYAIVSKLAFRGNIVLTKSEAEMYKIRIDDIFGFMVG